MKSFCIKTNNQKVINYLLKKIETSSLENVYFINKEFKCFKNVIVHYLGKNTNEFLSILTEILTNSILVFYEPDLLKKFLNINYFYFDEFEKNLIIKNCCDYMSLEENNTLKYRKEEIWTKILEYLNENKSIVLEGFVNFRLPEYIKTLQEILDYSVKEYVVEKEYNEFIELLRLYINSKSPNVPLIHLIYINGESILLDDNKNIVNLDEDIFDIHYLSDISFSSNDFALNTLLTLLPQKIEIHLCSKYEDEFISTLKLIFENRIKIFTNSSLCTTYKILNNVKI